jgi:hypothetical protein
MVIKKLRNRALSHVSFFFCSVLLLHEGTYKLYFQWLLDSSISPKLFPQSDPLLVHLEKNFGDSTKALLTRAV